MNCSIEIGVYETVDSNLVVVSKSKRARSGGGEREREFSYFWGFFNGGGGYRNEGVKYSRVEGGKGI